MHPLLLLPTAILGFLLGKKAAKRTTADAAGAEGGEPAAGVVGARGKGRRDLNDLDPEAWAEFVSVMETAPRNKVSARYKLGAFQMDARRLADVGVMTEAKKVSYGPEMGVWMGKWTPGLSESEFLGSMPLQYAAFVRSRRATAPQVSKHVGTAVEGKTATLSGLLGVAHVAGVAGVESWVNEPAVRRRFGTTTSVFHRCNGIF
jgi:hypothetical protein